MITLDVESGAGTAGASTCGRTWTPSAPNARTTTPMPGSRRSATCASTACRSAAASPSAATRSGGSRSCTCTRSRRSCSVMRTLAAFDALVERERPLAVSLRRGAPSGRHRAGGRRAQDPLQRTGLAARRTSWALLRMDARARALAARRAAVAAARRAAPPRRARASRRSCIPRSGESRSSARATEAPTAAPSPTSARCCARSKPASRADDIRYVGIGARTNFRARRWWDPLVAARRNGDRADRALRAGRRRWRTRARSIAIGIARAGACGTAPICAPTPSSAAATAGRSCAQQLAGIALLQFPWSARSMDEAAAALGRARARRRRHLRRGRRLGTRARARMPAARDSARRACSTASSTATG